MDICKGGLEVKNKLEKYASLFSIKIKLSYQSQTMSEFSVGHKSENRKEFSLFWMMIWSVITPSVCGLIFSPNT